MPIQPSGPLDERKFVRVTPGCWWWLGGKDYRGYGVAWVDLGNRKGNARAHRVMYEWYINEIPKGSVLRHKCNNPSCVNPYHLEPGTQADNIADAVKAGRHCHKETHGCAKLTQKEVDEIRELAKHHTHRAIAKQFGMGKSTITRIISNQSWKD